MLMSYCKSEHFRFSRITQTYQKADIEWSRPFGLDVLVWGSGP